MEESGYEYLEDLSRRSLILIEKEGIDQNSLRLSVCSDADWESIRTNNEGEVNSNQNNPNPEPIHTILFCMGHKYSHFDEWKHLISSRLVKVLKATSITLPYHPVEISELINLRYLDFTYESFDRTAELQLPESLSKLQNLQTIVIRLLWNHQFTARLPITIWRMPQLRHIILLNGFLSHPDLASPLVNLHALSRILNFTCSEKILEMLPNLKKLRLFYSFCEKGLSEYGLNNLVPLRRLEKLSLYAETSLNTKSLSFPVALRKLTLSCCRLPLEDMTIVRSLPNLEVLKLKRDACFGIEWETSEGEFCQLKVLLIDSSNDLNQWKTESSHFPRLEPLTLYECHDLEEIPTDIGEIPTHELIEVDVRNKRIGESVKAIQEEQENYGNHLWVSFLESRSWTW